MKDTILIEAVDPAFAAVADASAPFECIASGMQFTEGPVWRAHENDLLFSDLGDSKIYRWSAGDGLSLWRAPSNKTNGNTVDHRGRLISCEHESRRVTLTESEGAIRVLAERFRGRRLNSPNDVVVKRDGSVWFTDPPYGIRPEEMEQDANHVFRLDPRATEPVAVVSCMTRPNGLCFSPDERFLYVADSDTAVCEIRRFRVCDDNSLEGGLEPGGGEVFACIAPGVPDGIRVDAAGRFYSTAGDGVQVFAADGRFIGRIRTPESAANCRFGGEALSTLFITARSRVWRVELETRGIV